MLYVCTKITSYFLIQKPQHPEGEFSAIGHIPVVGEDVGVFYSGYLREVLATAANLESVFAVHLEVALRLTILHVVRLHKTAYGKGLAQGADVHLSRSQRIEDVGILQINLVGLGQFTNLLLVGIQQVQHLGIAQILEVFHHRVATNLKGGCYPVGIQFEGYLATNQGDECLQLPDVGHIDLTDSGQLGLDDIVHHLLNLGVVFALAF